MTNKTTNIFYKIFISVFLVSSIPLLMMAGIFYYFSINSLDKEIELTNLSNLTQLKDKIDVELKNIKQMAQTMGNDDYLLSQLRKGDAVADIEAMARLLAYKQSDAFVEELLMYGRGEKYIYTSARRLNYYDFEEKLYKDYNWASSEFFGTINASKVPLISYIQPRNPQSAQNKLVYIFPLPYLSSAPTFTAVFILDISAVKSQFVDYMGGSNKYIFVYDNYYKPIMANQPLNAPEPAELSAKLASLRGLGVMKTVIGSTTMSVTRVVSQESGWSFISATPAAEFYSSAHRRKRIILASLAVVFFMLVLFTYIISKNSYKPVQSLLTYIGIVNPDVDKSKNEWEQIRVALDTTFTKNKQLADDIDAQRALVRDQCLTKVIRGRIKDLNELEYLLKCSGLEIGGSYYFVMAVSTRMLSGSVSDMEKALKLLGEVVFADGRALGVEFIDDKYIAMLTILNDFNGVASEKQLEIGGYIHSRLSEDFGLKVKIGIGSVVSDLLTLGTSFLEAGSALNDSLSNAQTDICLFSNPDVKQPGQAFYPTVNQALFIQSLHQGDADVAFSIIENMAQEISQSIKSYLILRCVCYDVITNVIKTLGQKNFDLFNPEIIALSEITSISEFEAAMKQFAEKFCGYINKTKENSSYELKKLIISYLSSDYRNKNLSLEFVAGKYGVSATYLSRLIKGETGYTFNEFITNLRMNEMKHKLVTTDLPIKDIINEIGYIDSSSFIRKFKMLEGVTPSQYRGVYKKGE